MKERKVQVVLNSNRVLLPSQMDVLNKTFGEGKWEVFSVPVSEGIDHMTQNIIADRLLMFDVVFATPIPYMMARLSYRSGVLNMRNIYILHNDSRPTKSVYNKKKRQYEMIHVLPETNWVILPIFE